MPSSPQLPEDRVSSEAPFSMTGVDFGPLYVQASKEPLKTYVCLFTCGSTRAIHLELISQQLHSFWRLDTLPAEKGSPLR